MKNIPSAPVILLALAGLVSLTGCTTPVEMVDTYHDTGPAVAGLDYRDFTSAAGKMVSGMIASGAIDNPKGGRYVLAINRVANRTMQDIDTDQLVKKIRVDLLKSGKVIVTTAVSGAGAEDTMTRNVRELANDDLFDKNTVAKKGTVIAPDLSLTGKIIERKIKIDRSRQQIEYVFQLSLTQLSTGLAVWEDEAVIVKRADR